MGQHQITEKLGVELKSLEVENSILDEKLVVYFLVEAKKMMDHEKSVDSFPAIKFYRDWAVHTKKDAIPPFVEEMFRNSDNELGEFIKMEYLREEMMRFLEIHNLPNLLTTEKIWKIFWRRLIDVLSEQPMILKTAVSKFEFRTTNDRQTIIYDCEA